MAKTLVAVASLGQYRPHKFSFKHILQAVVVAHYKVSLVWVHFCFVQRNSGRLGGGGFWKLVWQSLPDCITSILLLSQFENCVKVSGTIDYVKYRNTIDMDRKRACQLVAMNN